MTKASAKRGDIYYVTGTEAIGSEQAGQRPAIIVSNDVGNRFAPIVEVVYLTTKEKSLSPTHVYINSAERPSTALCEQVVTVCKSRLKRYIGSVTMAEMRRIDKALSVSLGIKREAGGNVMQITMKTPYMEMNFDMTPEKAQELIQKAIQYASEESSEESVCREELKQEQPRPTVSRPKSRVENLFGSFRTEAQEARDQNSESDERSEPEEYKGFLLIKCKHCGQIKGFCAKTPINEFSCECGGKTELHDLKIAHLHCRCGSHWKYKTNITEEKFEYNCLNCGSPVDMELNSRRNTYVTIQD